jgi:hypothetical protein
MAENNSEQELITHQGGCHCGKIKWQVQAPANLHTHTCNCSICEIHHYQHLIVPKDRFHLLTDAQELSEYRFGSGHAKHYFCKTCGTKSFYIPRSNPDGVSIHARCLNPASVLSITDTPFDGQNWEKNAASLAHLSKV